MPMHRREVHTGRRALLLTPLVAVALAGCGHDDGADGADATMHLRITASDAKDVVTVNAAEGVTASIDNRLVGDFEVEIESVTDTEVEFTTSEDMAPEGKTGGINLNDTRSDFRVKQRQDVKFSTPTMDESTTWTATLEDGPAPS